MPLVAGVDSSTQSCKVVIRDAGTGQLIRQGRASHPDATEVDPQAWWVALESALAEAGGQPQISVNSGAWTNTGIGVLVAIGNGRYSAPLTQAAVNGSAGDWI